ncbi:MAG: protein phosphatase [Rhodobacteraceae bacterium]|nr:protein phosphatase [Paracoccaceae bacterium]
MQKFAIYPVELASGTVAISPIPGRSGDFPGDLRTILKWSPSLVLTMTTSAELRAAGATDLPIRLHEVGVGWLHLPIVDFGAPHGETAAFWPTASAKACEVLAGGGRVLAHCWGGHGRSGMAALRLMVESGVAVEDGLERLRKVRPGAVETEMQMRWAREGSS